ncbi:MAG: oligosaccharide flippase family protein [Actinobacteria bacterium]|nr:oligosaccharide flippase family protein [Actinomycetota bacterium]
MSGYTGGTRRYLSVGAAVGLLGQAVVIGGGILAQMIIARNLTTVDFGIYSLVTTLTFLGAIILRCGLHGHAVRRLAQLINPAEVHREAREIAMLSIVVAGLALPLLGLVVLPVLNRIFFDKQLTPAIHWVVAVTISFEAVRYVISEAFRGLHKQVATTILGNAGRTLLIVATLGTAVAVTEDLDLATTLCFILAASVLTALVGGLALWVRTAPRSGSTPKLSGRRSLRTLSCGSPFLVTELSAFALAMGDVLVVGLIGTHDDVAVYAASSRAASMLAIPAFVMVGVLNPVISTTWAQGETEKLQRILRLCLAVVMVPTVCALIAIALYGGDILRLLFGQEYSRGATYFLVLAAGAAGTVILGMGFQVLMICGRARIATAVAVAFSAGTLLNQLLLAQFWGVQGVAVASASGTLLALVTSAVICRYLTGVRAYPGALNRRATFQESLSESRSSHHRSPDS